MEEKKEQVSVSQPNIVLPPVKKTLVAIGGAAIFLAITLLNAYGARVALPVIIAEFNAGQYYVLLSVIGNIMAALAAPIGGKLGDIFGRKKMVMIIMVLLLVTNLLQWTIPSTMFWVFFVCRLVSGFTGGLGLGIMGAVIADVTTLAERPRYTSLISVFTAISVMIGAGLGGLIVDNMGPRWIYFFSCFFNIALLILFGVCYVNKPSEKKVKIDWGGMFFLALFLTPGLVCTSLVYKKFQWTDPIAILLLLASLVGLICLIWWEKNKAQSPLIPFQLFTYRSYRAAVIIIMCLLAYNSLVTSYLPLYMQSGQGFTATMSGFVSTPKGILGIVLPGLIAGWLTAGKGRNMMRRTRIANIGAAFLIVIAAIVFFVMNGKPMNAMYVAFIAALCLIGVGEALYKVAGQPLVQAEVPNVMLGASMAIYSFCQTVSNTVYPAIYGAIYNGNPDGINGAWPIMCVVCIVFIALGVLATLVLLKKDMMKGGKE